MSSENSGSLGPWLSLVTNICFLSVNVAKEQKGSVWAGEDALTDARRRRWNQANKTRVKQV